MWSCDLRQVLISHPDEVTMSLCVLQEGDEEDVDETGDKPLSSHPDADTTILFVTGEGWFSSPFDVFRVKTEPCLTLLSPQLQSFLPTKL